MRKTKEDAEKTRKQLLDAAYDVFLEQGYDAATIAEIAGRAQLTRGAVYWHFKNKEEVFIAVVEQALNDQQNKKIAYTQSSEMTVGEKLKAILALPLEMAESYRLVNSVPELSARIPAFLDVLHLLQERKQNLRRFFKEFLTEHTQDGSIYLHGDVDTAALMLFVIFEGLYYHGTEQSDICVDNLEEFLSVIMDFPA